MWSGSVRVFDSGLTVYCGSQQGIQDGGQNICILRCFYKHRSQQSGPSGSISRSLTGEFLCEPWPRTSGASHSWPKGHGIPFQKASRDRNPEFWNKFMQRPEVQGLPHVG